jgi:hypothetical protein
VLRGWSPRSQRRSRCRRGRGVRCRDRDRGRGTPVSEGWRCTRRWRRGSRLGMGMLLLRWIGSGSVGRIGL